MTKIQIEVSARHCHLSRKDIDKLFGKGYRLQPIKELSQTGQFAANETVTLRAKDGEISRVRVLGPERQQSQIELSYTDARKLKMAPPVRLSGDLAGTPGITLVGPAGEVKLKSGVIIAQRHIHADPATAKKLGLSEKKSVSVAVAGERAAVFNKIAVRISPDFVFRMHIDTDEANAVLPDGYCGAGKIVA